MAVGVLLVLTLLASYLATRLQRQVDFFTITLAIFLVHILGHVAQTMFFRQYTPGLITALLVVLPYSLYGFHRLFTANLVGGDSFTTSILIGALLLAPLLLAVRQLGKLLAR